MKCRVKTLNDMVHDEVSKELKKARNRIYDEITADVVNQTIGWFLYHLDVKCGYRSKRLTDMVNGLQETIAEATNDGISPIEVAQHLKNKYGIDLYNEVESEDESR